MKRMLITLATLALLPAAQVRAEVITFDDLPTRDSFFTLGIQSSYKGFGWGYSNTPGLGGAVLPTDNHTGWASGTVADPAWFPAPTPVSGDSYAWNWNGPQSLFIDFLTPHDVAGGYFATLSSDYFFNASTIQFFGYDSAGNQIASSGILSLTDAFQYLSAGFVNVNKLEIRANADSAWFSIDDLEVTKSDVVRTPEPGSLTLMGLAGVSLAGYAGWRRRRSRPK